MLAQVFKPRSKTIGKVLFNSTSALTPFKVTSRFMSTTPGPSNLINGESHDFTKEKYDAVIIGGGHNGLV